MWTTFIEAVTGFFSSVWLYIIGAVAVLSIAYGGYHLVYSLGITECVSAQQQKQLQQDKKVNNDYAQIDAKTPYGASQRAVADFLLRNIRPN